MIYYTNISCVAEWANMAMGASGMISWSPPQIQKALAGAVVLSYPETPNPSLRFAMFHIYNVLLFVDCWIGDIIQTRVITFLVHSKSAMTGPLIEDQLLPLPNLLIGIGRYWKMYIWGAKDVIVHLFPFLHDRSYCQCILVLISRKNKQ